MGGFLQDYQLIVSVEQNSTSNMLSCKKGDFISFCHNHLRNITVTLLKEICKDIRVEPQLQELTGEILHPSTITGNEAKLDIYV